eukprot:3205780-Amphidinium_carterae.1
MLHCPHWNKERREACLPEHAAIAPACVRLHGLLPAPGPRIKLPKPVEEEIVVEGLAEPVAHDAQAPHVEGPHRRVVTYNTFARCLDCHRQIGMVRGKFNFTYLRGQACRPLKKNFKARQDPPPLE